MPFIAPAGLKCKIKVAEEASLTETTAHIQSCQLGVLRLSDRYVRENIAISRWRGSFSAGETKASRLDSGLA